ncbi:poly(A)-specific ribonuclease PARN isoform X2 [Copidosoma floridanum]|uniref:poly(A)-specific ribonuclease PARN isoform X2 n=1 Tax=Copidosoma floridanum TaxID=29053 RepID=UPI0006C984DF|nr:poly(A)-specific ribonuclease PARN isoform X2 [Copidosoma floridanum]
MEVTCINFQEILTELDDVLDNATFLAIDGEFTGLSSGPDASAFDTPAQYYAKLRTGSMDFLLVQLGLSVFTHNPATNKYSQRSYNFYVFPKSFNRTTPDCRFKCQASSIAFLANQGFDFNKLFKYGIPYLTKEEEEKLNKKLEEKQKARDEDEFDLIPIPDQDKSKIEEICSKIDNFVDSEEKEFIIDKCNAFIRRLTHQEVKIRWPNKIKLQGKNENGNAYLVAYKVGTDDEEKVREAERKEKENLQVQEAIGLSALLKKIVATGKLVVGHNMLLDLCHIIHQFFGPLPESYKEFKNLVHSLFPRLLDTKIVCQSSQFKDSVPSVLNHLLETIQNSPFKLPETEDVRDRSYTLNNDKLHEAGYDAYITGLCFISLCDRLGSLQKLHVSTVLADSPLLNPYINKLLISRLKDYPYINLTGKDPNPSRDHVFHITFPKQWKISDLSQLFSPYGGAYVSWLSDTTAYVALYRREQVNAVIKNLFKSTQCNIQKYVDHQASLENEKPIKSERKRKISERDSPPVKEDRCDSTSTTAVAAATAKGEPAASDSTGASPSRDENGWEVASGKRRRKRNRIQATSETELLQNKNDGGRKSFAENETWT